ncbi:hypothetical protein CgunFtcFv8_013817 [Champsocephalus gunnari]|uniref:Uncharacterized protein n=1 Tax=Champsocephalus gunnari TaxID=52237 RepID=A0AAN8E405_CHAGU|nr:hypothetical protein CgunFtcFv8_013817 [Champsocephalus gunnari]
MCKLTHSCVPSLPPLVVKPRPPQVLLARANSSVLSSPPSCPLLRPVFSVHPLLDPLAVTLFSGPTALHFISSFSVSTLLHGGRIRSHVPHSAFVPNLVAQFATSCPDLGTDEFASLSACWFGSGCLRRSWFWMPQVVVGSARVLCLFDGGGGGGVSCGEVICLKMGS